jgi:CRISPR-associated protein Cmr4
MITATSMLYLYVETPLHAGTGSGLSSIDLPIQRERTTQYPMIQGSGIKGKLRAAAEDALEAGKLTQSDVDVLFGAAKPVRKKANGSTSAQQDEDDTAERSDHAGALIAGDARILLFPVRTLNGVFAYTTSYDVLSRFKRDIERKETELPWKVPASLDNEYTVLVTTKSDVQSNSTIVMEEFSYDTKPDTSVDTIAKWLAENALPDLGGDYWANKLKSSLVILPDVVFRDFALYATEVITRVRLNRETKTVDTGALWTEEHLPTDTLMYVPMYATNSRKKDKDMSGEAILKTMHNLNNTYLQLGGDETVGRGLVRIRWGNITE